MMHVDEGPIIHKSVLVNEVLHYLNPQADGVYIDATFGSGGHTRALLTSQEDLKVIALDWDKISLETYGPIIEEEFPGRVRTIWGNFANLYKIAHQEKIKAVDGILADFGTSQMQIHNRPGFSVYRNSPLDMRMSPGYYQTTAADVINSASAHDLAHIFWTYGQERHANAIARAVVHWRGILRKITTTQQLVDVILKVVPYKKTVRIHPATRVFQALRIYVNHELEHIQSFIAAAIPLLKPGGRLVCISFHSLEDSIVKDMFLQKASDGTVQVLTKKIVTASDDEIKHNSSARSAKLRAVERI